MARAYVAVARLLHHPRAPLALLGLVSLLSLRARLYRLGDPDKSSIFDERYYVNAARIILGLHVAPGDPYAGDAAGHDPNAEHPPLAKLIIAGTMRLFGDNPTGWRIGPVIFGSLAILAMYWLVRSAGGGSWAALGAATLMSVDNLSLVAGRIAVLDVFTAVFMMVGVALYLRGHGLLGGVVLGVGATTKLFGALALLVLVLLESQRVLRAWRGDGAPFRRTLLDRLTPLLTCLAAALVGYLAALYLLDLGFSDFRNPLLHTRSMFDYGRGLTTHDPEGIASYPWEWLLNTRVINYYSFDVNIMSGGKVVNTHPLIAFQGAMNPAVIFLALPALGLAVHTALRDRDDLSFLVLAWCLGTFIPFVVLSVAVNRIQYLYYMVVVLPGVYIGLTRLFSRRTVPLGVTLGWVCLAGYGFWSQFPFRTWPSGLGQLLTG